MSIRAYRNPLDTMQTLKPYADRLPTELRRTLQPVESRVDERIPVGMLLVVIDGDGEAE